MLLKAQFRLRRNFRLPLKTHKYHIKEISASHSCKGRNSWKSVPSATFRPSALYWADTYMNTVFLLFLSNIINAAFCGVVLWICYQNQTDSLCHSTNTYNTIGLWLSLFSNWMLAMMQSSVFSSPSIVHTCTALTYKCSLFTLYYWATSSHQGNPGYKKKKKKTKALVLCSLCSLQ